MAVNTHLRYVLVLVMGIYVLLVTQVLWKARSGDLNESELPNFDKSHFAEDQRQGILYHHRNHPGHQIPSQFRLDVRPAKEPRGFQAARILLGQLDSRSIHLFDYTDWNISTVWLERSIGPPNIDYLTSDLHSSKVEKAHIVSRDDSWREILLTLKGNQVVKFVPKFYDIDFVIIGNKENIRQRHYSHIVAYHLSRLLGLYHVPFAMGRKFDLIKHITSVATNDFLNYIFKFDGKTCISLECPSCTNLARAVCADDSGVMEGSLLLLPSSVLTKKYTLRQNPWYTDHFENGASKGEKSLCGATNNANDTAFLLQTVDTTIFDFLMDNRDNRQFTLGINDTIRLEDNGFGLANPYLDNMIRLTPLQSCCKIRKSTFHRLQRLTDGILSQALTLRSFKDVLSPLATEVTLNALDRRLNSVLNDFRRCVTLHGLSNVLLE